MKNKIKEFIASFKSSLDNSKNILLSAHVSPDGDALGSLLSMTMGLRSLGYNAKALKVDKTPDYLNFIPNLDLLVDVESIDEEADMFIVLDCSTVDRIGDGARLYSKAKNTVVIDHHVSNANFADINLVVNTSSSTCEIVYNILRELNVEFDKTLATVSLTGIITDTNRFLYSSSNADTLDAASFLYRMGADKDLIYKGLYQSSSLGSFKLTGEVINNTIFSKDMKLAYVLVDDKMLTRASASIEDVEGMVNLIRDINGVELAILIKEIEFEKEYKVNLRSKDYVDCSKLALSFNGGGHLRAGGFSYFGRVQDLKTELFKRVEELDFN